MVIKNEKFCALKYAIKFTIFWMNPIILKTVSILLIAQNCRELSLKSHLITVIMIDNSFTSLVFLMQFEMKNSIDLKYFYWVIPALGFVESSVYCWVECRINKVY